MTVAIDWRSDDRGLGVMLNLQPRPRDIAQFLPVATRPA
jgi:hypothetical protein